jgi:CysZ protein
MSELSRGLGDLSRGFSFLGARPRLWGWVVAPALVTALLLVGLIVLATGALDGVVSSITSRLPSWISSIAGAGLTAVIVIVLGAASLLIFVSLAGALAGPFCEMLSEAVEEELTGKPGAPFSLPRFLADALQGIAHSLRRLFTAVLGAALLFALSFIPIIGTLAAIFLGTWFSSRAAAYDCYDAVLARRALPYGDKLAFLEQHRSRSLGLGFGVAALLFIPFANLLALSAGAVGATLASHELANRAAPRR